MTQITGSHTIVLENATTDKRYEDIAAIVFWCAYYGYKEQVEMYLNAKLSPFIKCYK